MEGTASGQTIARRAQHLGREARSRLLGALSSAGLYTLLFASIIALFGSSYVMIISPTVVIFRTRRKQRFSLSLIPRMIATLIVLNVLAYLATLHIALCVLLNATVPFLLVLVQSNQFAPKAYFSYVMAFVFLELRPHTFEEFCVQLTVTAYAACVLAVVLVITRWWKGRTRDAVGELDQALDTLANLLDRMAEGERSSELSDEFIKLERSFDRLCFAGRNVIRTPDRATTNYYMYAMLIQRAIYLLSDSAWERGDEARVDIGAMHDVAALIRQVRRARTPEQRAVIRRCLQMLLDVVDLPQGRIRIFLRSFLHMLMLIVSDARERRRDLPWHIAPLREVVAGLTRHIDRDSFEFRFAMRLTVVLVLTCSISMLWGYNHVYWLPLNAFLLLMPSYEESAHRMRARPIGTAIGCVVIYGVTHFVSGALPTYVFCMLMISLLYACTPGSWVQAIFSTSFALMMTSLTMQETTAMALRLLFVALAVAIVLVVNRFVLPSKRERIYECNKRQLSRFISQYWNFVRVSVGHHVSLSRTGEMLAEFHLVYGEAYAFANEIADASQREHEQARLSALWHMFSEVEQVEYLVLADELNEGDLELLRRAAADLHDHPIPAATGCEASALAAVVQSGDLRYALEHYIANGRMLGENNLAA